MSDKLRIIGKGIINLFVMFLVFWDVVENGNSLSFDNSWMFALVFLDRAKLAWLLQFVKGRFGNGISDNAPVEGQCPVGDGDGPSEDNAGGDLQPSPDLGDTPLRYNIHTGKPVYRRKAGSKKAGK